MLSSNFHPVSPLPVETFLNEESALCVESLESDQRKMNPEEMKLLVGNADNHLDELQPISVLQEETLYRIITRLTLRKPATKSHVWPHSVHPGFYVNTFCHFYQWASVPNLPF